VADIPTQGSRRDAALYFEVARRSPAAVVQTKVEILDATDDVRAWVDRQNPANDRGRVDVKLPLSTLAPGAYRLRVTAGDGMTTTAREVGIVVK
jgi:5-hydroxyisourate hydrolase-like protein (transthyretin family)